MFADNETRIIVDEETAARMARANDCMAWDGPEDRLYPEDEFLYTADFPDGYHVELHIYGSEYDGHVSSMMLLFNEDYVEESESDDESIVWGRWQMTSDVTGKDYFIDVVAESDL